MIGSHIELPSKIFDGYNCSILSFFIYTVYFLLLNEGQSTFRFHQHLGITKTRNDQCLLKLPRIKTEYACKSFCFMGAKIYNELPMGIRKTESLSDYKKLLRNHFS